MDEQKEHPEITILRSQRNQALDGLAACGGALALERAKSEALQKELTELKAKKKPKPAESS